MLFCRQKLHKEIANATKTRALLLTAGDIVTKKVLRWLTQEYAPVLWERTVYIVTLVSNLYKKDFYKRLTEGSINLASQFACEYIKYFILLY